ncbi:MAG: ATP-binding cassette domain-containing protein [Proteobacteria bacterium]|nr:ATP-binding cassette domain-containing protein [Pseudomonadota bacterium]
MCKEIIKINNLNFTYPRTEKALLRDINLEIKEGEFVIITGANGSGKTSLGKCINGLIPYSTGGVFNGRVEICGVNTLEKDVSELALYAGFVFPNPEDQLATPLVETEIAFGLCNLGIGRDMISQRVDAILDRFEIGQLRHNSTFDLSTGQQQMVAIASCAVMEPKVLILDDPIAHLNQNTSAEVVEIVKDLIKRGTTIIWISQDMSQVFEFADRVVLLDGGQIAFDGPPRGLSEEMDFTDLPVIAPQHLAFTHGLRRVGFPEDLIEISLDKTIRRLRGLMAAVGHSMGSGENSRSVDPKKSEPMIRFDQVSFQYPNGLWALKDIDLEFYSGDFVLLSGWNGSGKTTLMKHLNGLLRPTKGVVFVGGEDIYRKPTSQLARGVGFLFQNPDHQLHKPTVREELAFSLKNFGVPDERVTERILETSEEFGLESVLDRSPQELSGSEKKKVTVASVLIYDPRIVVLDEATANLDREQARNIIEKIEGYADENRIVISISHDVRMWAESDRLNRVIIMKDGQITDQGTPEKVLSNTEIMGHLYGGLLPVTQIACSLSDKGVSPTHYRTKSLTAELKRLAKGSFDVFAQ